MGTYYIKPDGLSQKDLVAYLKDIETAFGGTNVDEYITTTTTVDVTKWYDTNVAVSAAVSAGSTLTQAISARVSASVAEITVASYVWSAGISADTSTLAKCDVAPSYIQSCHTAGTAFCSSVSAAVSAGYAGGVLKVLSAMGSTLKSASVSGF